ncbi:MULTISPECIES: CYTH domain-containing protein [Allobacillus]|uniref:CYTH domain-containing protein n=1 Tax=Allobacillus salarius TaxID=1955272 RepID=A0A556PMD1_9BACI|nr:CYTH domain-containing protein [Allobacillus salarius]TSJ65508.1 CYTH domain-containing protein [Allobacillus salarius]
MQEIEIELKNELNEKEYTYLKNTLFKDAKVKEQTNHYFETNDFQLKNTGSALRIRFKNGSYVSTLKEPQTEGLLETHDQLDDQVASSWMNGQVSLGPNIRRQIEQLNISEESIRYFGQLTTYRQEVEKDDCLLVLDHSIYHKQEDYELEIEAPSMQKAQSKLEEILTTYQIERRPIESKIKRFFSAKQSDSH